MTQKTKNKITMSAALLIFTLFVLQVGSAMGRTPPKRAIFVGEVSNNIPVYDISGSDLGLYDAQKLWQWSVRGAPAPFQAVGAFLVKRIEIQKADFDQQKNCGSFTISTFGHFNRVISRDREIVVPCP